LYFAAVSTLAAALTTSQAEVARLTEWQDVVKRVADDRVAEAQQQLTAAQAAAAQQTAEAAGEIAAPLAWMLHVLLAILLHGGTESKDT
jgi:hypothetical protein